MSRPGLGDYERLSVRVCVCVSHFYINPYILFIYEDIFTKFAEDVYDCENMSVKMLYSFKKNNLVTIDDCSKIIDMF